MGSGVSKRRVAYIRDQVHTDVKGAETALENTQDRWHEEDAVWLENEHAATVLASLVKCHWEMRELARLKFERDRKAATKIQTAQRCRVERLAYKRIQRAVLAVQRRRRGCGSAVDVCRKLQHMWHLAKIGRCPRLACRWYLQLRRSAAVINRLARGYFGRKVRSPRCPCCFLLFCDPPHHPIGGDQIASVCPAAVVTVPDCPAGRLGEATALVRPRAAVCAADGARAGPDGFHAGGRPSQCQYCRPAEHPAHFSSRLNRIGESVSAD